MENETAPNTDEALAGVETEKTVTKAEKIEIDRQTLLNNVVSGHINSVRDRVAYILNQFPSARNSDIELVWNYWSTFESNVFNGHSVTKEQLYSLSRERSLIRLRAKIQNEYKLFQADEEVKRHRGVLEEETRTEVIEDKPADLPFYSVFIDETGKNQDYLAVGSLWVVDGATSYKITDEIKKWKQIGSIEYEFHFAELTRHRVQAYKDFFLKFLSLNPAIGFKVIVVNNLGFKGTNDAITDLTFHLINNGIEHEHATGRAPLPRLLQVWLDEEEKGSDRLKLENLRERLKGQKIQGLHLSTFEAVSSKSNFYMQAVDLVTASVNRKLHSREGGHFKDEVANYILELLNFDMTGWDHTNHDIDKSIVFNLTRTANSEVR